MVNHVMRKMLFATTMLLATGATAFANIIMDLDTKDGNQGVQSAQIKAGETKEIELIAEKGALGIAGFEVTIEFDTNQFQFKGFQPGGLMTGAITLPQKNTATGVTLSVGFLGGKSTADKGSLGKLQIVATNLKTGGKIALTKGYFGASGQTTELVLNTAVSLTTAAAKDATTGTSPTQQPGQQPQGQGTQPGQQPGFQNPGQGGTPPGQGQGQQPGFQNPGQGGTPPGQGQGQQPGQQPQGQGQGGTPPGQGQGQPGQQPGFQNPGQGGTPPGQGGTPPGQQTGQRPGQGGTPPGQGQQPQGQGTQPGQQPGFQNPGQGGTPPGQGGTPPGQQTGQRPGQGQQPQGQGTQPQGQQPGFQNPGQGGTPPGQQPGQPSAEELKKLYERWKSSPEAKDLNNDGKVDEADFKIFFDKLKGSQGSPSGQGGTPPGQSGTPPGQGQQPQGQQPGFQNPGQGGTPPGQGGTPPGQQTGQRPAQGGTQPGQQPGQQPQGQGQPGQQPGQQPQGQGQQPQGQGQQPGFQNPGQPGQQPQGQGQGQPGQGAPTPEALISTLPSALQPSFKNTLQFSKKAHIEAELKTQENILKTMQETKQYLATAKPEEKTAIAKALSFFNQGPNAPPANTSAASVTSASQDADQLVNRIIESVQKKIETLKKDLSSM